MIKNTIKFLLILIIEHDIGYFIKFYTSFRGYLMSLNCSDQAINC